MATIIKPPTPLVLPAGQPSLFLAGSIAMGTAEHWQADVEQAFAHAPLTILNPRRDAWDATWEQSLANPPFREQVEWELAGLEQATLVVIYFAPTTQAPVTLLEFGLCAHSGRLLVCCPPGFWRKGNVDVVCARYSVPQVDTLAALIAVAGKRLGLPASP